MAQVRVHHLEDLMAGIKAENNSLFLSYRDIKQLIEDRHMAQVRVHHLEDLMAGIKAENNSYFYHTGISSS